MRNTHGFSLVEMLVVILVIGVLAAIAVPVSAGLLSRSRADTASFSAMTTIQAARNRAVAERRNVKMTFVAPNRIVVERIEVPGPAITVVETLILENDMTFSKYTTTDTLDGFGPAAATAIQFTGTQPVMFTSDGSLIDDNGDVSNGTVFMGRANVLETARAVTIFGATGFIRPWKWGGTAWIQ